MESFSSYSSCKNPPAARGKVSRNWEELPSDVLVSILTKLAPLEILDSIQLVCKSWHEACKNPAAWTKVDIHFSCDPKQAFKAVFGQVPDWLSMMAGYPSKLIPVYLKIASAAINRSCGRLLEITLERVCDESLLWLIADEASNLRCLRIRCCYAALGDTPFELFEKLPHLEEAEFTLTWLGPEMIKLVGHNCPKLVSFKLNERSTSDPDQIFIEQCNENAVAIAESMPHIRHLQLIGSLMTNKGLEAILNNCSCLELLDLRACFHIDLSGELGKRCAEKVKVVKWPHDSTTDYKFPTMNESSDDDDDDDDDDYDDELGKKKGVKWSDYRFRIMNDSSDDDDDDDDDNDELGNDSSDDDDDDDNDELGNDSSDDDDDDDDDD